SWTFVLWGLYHGLWLCLETVTLPRADALQARIAARRPLAGKLFAAARCLLTFCIVSAGWAVFRANSPADLGYLLTNWTRGLNPLRLGAYAAAAGMDGAALAARSEEHTSELQSRFDLVCRLLLVNKILELQL